MSKETVRLPDYQSEGLAELKRQTGMNKSEIVRGALSKFIASWDDMEEIPEWITNEASHDRIIRENRHKMRAMHLKQNVYEYLLHSCLTGEDGKIARYPPSPEKVRENYGESVREQIDEEFDQYADEYHRHLEMMLDWYEVVHPDTHTGADGLVQQTVFWLRWHGEEVARKFLDECEQRGEIPKRVTIHDILDEARDQKRTSDWKAEWDDSIHP